MKLRTRVNDLAERQNNGLDMVISSTDIDQRQNVCLVEEKHLKAFKPFKFHFNRFIFYVSLEKIGRLKKYCRYR